MKKPGQERDAFMNLVEERVLRKNSSFFAHLLWEIQGLSKEDWLKENGWNKIIAFTGRWLARVLVGAPWKKSNGCLVAEVWLLRSTFHNMSRFVWVLPFFSIGDLWDNLNRPDRVTFPKTPLHFGEIRDTPPKFNMEPENASLERETHRLKPPVLGFLFWTSGAYHNTSFTSDEQLTTTTFCEFFMVTFLLEELWRMACLKLASNPPDDARLALEATWTSQWWGVLCQWWGWLLWRKSQCLVCEGSKSIEMSDRRGVHTSHKSFFLNLTWSHEENYSWLIKRYLDTKGLLLYTYSIDHNGKIRLPKPIAGCLQRDKRGTNWRMLSRTCHEFGKSCDTQCVLGAIFGVFLVEPQH